MELIRRKTALQEGEALFFLPRKDIVLVEKQLWNKLIKVIMIMMDFFISYNNKLNFG